MNWKLELENKREAYFKNHGGKYKNIKLLTAKGYSYLTLEGLKRCITEWVIFSGGKVSQINRGLKIECNGLIAYVEIELYPKRQRSSFKPEAKDWGILTFTAYSMESFVFWWKQEIEKKEKAFKPQFIPDSLLLTKSKYSFQGEYEEQSEPTSSSI